MKRILIIEDNKKIRGELSIFLSKNGYQCIAPENFENVVQKILAQEPHLVLLDINLPAADGYHICRELRKSSDVPVIVVTSRDTEMDELTAMNLGADDFVTKPYNLQILLMRIASVLKRSYKERAQDTLDCGDFSVSLSKSLLICGEKETELTKNELKILSCLCENRGAIVSRDTLMVQLWNSELFVDDNTLTVNINRLRKKLQSAGLKSTIQTKRGQGYLMP